MSEDTQVEVIADASQNQQTEYAPEVVEVETEEGQEQASSGFSLALTTLSICLFAKS